MRTRILGGLFATMLTLLAGVVGLAVDVRPAVAAPATDGGTEAAFVASINSVRAGAGLAPLEVYGELVSVARRWTDAQAEAGDISHNPSLTGQVSAPWTVIGENVGAGYGVDDLMDAFIASSSHYANIVDGGYTHIGVGVTPGWDGRMYTTHVFMTLPSAPPPPPPAPDPAPVAAPTPEPALAPVAEPAPKAAPPAPVAAAEPERVRAVLSQLRLLDA